MAETSPIHPLIDTHCHLDHHKFGDEPTDALVDRARAVGVTTLITIGTARKSVPTRRAYELAQRFPGVVYSTIGVHPHDAEDSDPSHRSEVEELARQDDIYAVGEAGLDFYYDHSPRETQTDVFRWQIGLARELNKPLIVHTRDAAAETLKLLRDEKAHECGGIIHCFSEDPEFAKAALDLGFVSSFSGIVTFKSAPAIQAAAKAQPADAILVETDAPYLAPIPKRGKRNEPAYVSHTLDFIARLRDEEPSELRRQTTENARRIFRLPS